MSNEYKVGDRVIIVTDYWRSGGGGNKMWLPKGSTGTVISIFSSETVHVKWDGRDSSLYIDNECIEHEGPTKEELAEVYRILLGGET